MEFKEKKKLIVIKPNGNHSNRLLQNLHFEMFCKEHQIEYHNPTFSDMAGYYNEPCNANTNYFYKFLQIDLLGKLFRHSRIVKKLFSIVWIISKLTPLKLVRFDKQSEISKAESTLLDAFKKYNVVYTAGWKFRLSDHDLNHQDEIIKKYTLKTTFIEKSELAKKAEELKSDGCTLIGIHIRRGDYKKWKGGKYCYNDAVYKKHMNSISEQLSNQGKLKKLFILFSNETLDFKESSEVIISKESWYIDQHIMSLCDYLVGPPSTFTLWASMLGKAKLFHIHNSHDNIKI